MAEETETNHPDKQGNNRENGAVGKGSPPVETRFKPGQSGNPKGRPKYSLVSDAMRQKLAEPDPLDSAGRTYAEVIASKLVETAALGNLAAVKEVVDRVEGKPRQTVTLSMEQREQYERIVEGMVSDTGCTREAAVWTLARLRPEASELLN